MVEKESKVNKKDVEKESLKDKVEKKVTAKKVLGVMKAKEPEPTKKVEKVGRSEKKLAAASRDPWSVLKWSKLTEKAIAQVERENKLVFVVRSGATRYEIKSAVESAFEVKVSKVNVAIDPKGQKKAFVRLSPDYSALDIATKLGMM